MYAFADDVIIITEEKNAKSMLNRTKEWCNLNEIKLNLILQKEPNIVTALNPDAIRVGLANEQLK